MSCISLNGADKPAYVWAPAIPHESFSVLTSCFFYCPPLSFIPSGAEGVEKTPLKATARERPVSALGSLAQGRELHSEY